MSLLEMQTAEALLHDCATGKRTASDLIQALGLESENPGGTGAPKFKDDDVKELYTHIGAAAEHFVSQNNDRSAKDLMAMMHEEDTFAHVLAAIALQFGERIWNRADRTHMLFAGQKTLYPHVLRWDRPKDQEMIKIYLRCWIVKRASLMIIRARDKQKTQASNTPDKGKKPASHPRLDTLGRSAAREDAEVASTTAGNDLIGVAGPSAAPIARMYPTPQPPESARRHMMASVVSADSSEEDLDSLCGDVIPPALGTVRAGTKRNQAPVESPRGKLPKVNGWRQQIPEMPKHARGRRETLSPPRSPSPIFAPEPPLAYGRRRQPVESQERDPDYVPSRGGSAETETLAEVTDQELMNTMEYTMNNMGGRETSTVNGDHSSLETARPFSVFDSMRDDSVIPPDDEDVVDLTMPEHGIASAMCNAGRSPTIVPDGSRAFFQQPRADQALRRELFRLLLSRLNRINEFESPDTAPDAEARLDHLLNQFWVDDAVILKFKYRDFFPQLDKAFTIWMKMRSHLQSFRNSSKYFGQPGEEWKAHLRALTASGERAQACIALANLKDAMTDERVFNAQSYGENLATVFDELTSFTDCNGVEEFQGVIEYNRSLLVWFR